MVLPHSSGEQQGLCVEPDPEADLSSFFSQTCCRCFQSVQMSGFEEATSRERLKTIFQRQETGCRRVMNHDIATDVESKRHGQKLFGPSHSQCILQITPNPHNRDEQWTLIGQLQILLRPPVSKIGLN